MKSVAAARLPTRARLTRESHGESNYDTVRIVMV